MNVIHRIEKWGDTHHPRFLDIIRILLGVFLLLKGLGFMNNTANLKTLIETRADITVAPWLLRKRSHAVGPVLEVRYTAPALPRQRLEYERGERWEYQDSNDQTAHCHACGPCRAGYASANREDDQYLQQGNQNRGAGETCNETNPDRSI